MQGISLELGDVACNPNWWVPFRKDLIAADSTAFPSLASTSHGAASRASWRLHRAANVGVGGPSETSPAAVAAKSAPQGREVHRQVDGDSLKKEFKLQHLGVIPFSPDEMLRHPGIVSRRSESVAPF